MSEIIKEVKQLEEGGTHIAGCEDFLITEDHTINDVLRLLIKQAGGKEDLVYLLDEMKEVPREI